MTDSQKWLALVLVAGLGFLVYLLAPVLTPFVIGALLAYFGDPVADRLEAWGLSRTSSVVVVFFVMAAVLGIVLLMLLPMLEQQVSSLIGKLPGFLDWFESSIVPGLEARFGVNIDIPDADEIMTLIKQHWEKAGGLLAVMVGSISRSGLAVLGWGVNMVLVPVVTFYLLRDWDILVEKTASLLPRRVSPTVVKLAAESDEVLGAFLLGQFSVMLCLGSIYTIGLWIVGVELALLIGMIAGMVSFIPYLGTIIGVVLAVIAALMQFNEIWVVVPVLVVFGVGQMLEGMLLTPLLVGDKIGLHPVSVIFAVMAGGQLFGFLGILLALPVASVIMVLVRHAHDVYKLSALYRVESRNGIKLPEEINEDRSAGRAAEGD